MLRDLAVNAAKPRYPWVFERLCMMRMQPRPLIGLAARPWYPAAIRTGSHEHSSIDDRRRDHVAQR